MGSTLSRDGADWLNAGLETRGPYVRVHAVNVYVRDLDRSLRFYVETLGFDLSFDARLPTGQRSVGVSPPDGGTVLALVAPTKGTPEHNLIGRATQVVFVTDDVAARFRDWTKRGVRFRHTPRLRRVRFDRPAPDPLDAELEPPDQRKPVWGGVFTRFEDLDRNSFELVSFDEVSQAIEARRQAAAQKLESERRSVQELEIAKQVQARLFPQALPKLRTLDYAGICIQARHVGGDYYDFLQLGSERVGLVIGDIAGKGIAAALLMANLQANLRSRYALALDDLPRLLKSVNQLFYENTPDDRYATLFFAVYDDHSRELEYANCGHNAPLLFRANGSLERLDSTSTVIGMFPDWVCVTWHITLAPGDLLVIYTDGVTEAIDASGNEFGEGRLIETVQAHLHESPEQLLTRIQESVQKFSAGEQFDDLTLVIARSR